MIVGLLIHKAAGIAGAAYTANKRAVVGLTKNTSYGEPAEIAAVAVFLASDDSKLINGQAIAVDGGWTSYM